MDLPPLIHARLVERPNRFLGIIDVEGRREKCHIPNPGRMRELLYPEASVWVSRNPGQGKTGYKLLLAEHQGQLISVDSTAPNRIAAEAIESGAIPEFAGLRVERAEKPYGDSRLDFSLTGASSSLLLEVKGCTLVEDGVAWFPDAPTARGARHLRALKSALGAGRAAVFFVIQRSDARVLKPNDATDPGFAEALREAAYKGVEVLAYGTRVSLRGIVLSGRIPVDLSRVEPDEGASNVSSK